MCCAAARDALGFAAAVKGSRHMRRPISSGSKFETEIGCSRAAEAAGAFTLPAPSADFTAPRWHRRQPSSFGRAMPSDACESVSGARSKQLLMVFIGSVAALAATGGAHLADRSSAASMTATSTASVPVARYAAVTGADTQAGGTASPLPPAASPVRGLCEQASPPSPTISGNVDSYSAEGWPVIAGKAVRLRGVETLSPAQVAGMKAWVNSHNNYLECQAVNADSYRCQNLRGLDLACIVLFNGGARASPDAEPAYRDAEQQARDARRGVWK
jgi:endonuclease YncB( thermonuclease family)